MADFKNVAVVGIGQTKIGKLPGKSSLTLKTEAARAALEDAGLRKSDVDGLIIIPSLAEPYLMENIAICDHLELTLSYNNMTGVAGAAGCAAVMEAAMAITLGFAHTVLIIGGDNPLSGFQPGHTYDRIDEFDGPYGLHAPAQYALVAQRHMHQYGTTPLQLAEVAVTCRKHASMMEESHMRRPINHEDVLTSKLIATPFHMLDCCLISDGAAAVVVTTKERARDLRKPPVAVLGTGQGHSHDRVWLARDLTTSTAVASGKHAFQMAGVAPKDIDVAELYDCFTITPIVLLEDLGFCKKGEGGPFVEGGRIRLGGELPINTHGGLLSHGQPGMCGGFLHVLEAVRQVRGEAGPRQVRGAELALAHTNGGILGTECTAIFGKG